MKRSKTKLGRPPKVAPMERQFLAVPIRVDGMQRKRTFHINAQAAANEATSKIVSNAHQQKKAIYAIVQVIGIVEPVTPTIEHRKPRKGDDGPAPSDMGYSYGVPNWILDDSMRNVVQNKSRMLREHGTVPIVDVRLPRTRHRRKAHA